MPLQVLRGAGQTTLDVKIHQWVQNPIQAQGSRHQKLWADTACPPEAPTKSWLNQKMEPNREVEGVCVKSQIRLGEGEPCPVRDGAELAAVTAPELGCSEQQPQDHWRRSLNMGRLPERKPGELTSFFPTREEPKLFS